MAKKLQDRKLIDEQLTAGIRKMLDLGMEPEEVARRVVKLITQIAGEKHIAALHRRRDASSILTPKRIREAQAAIEASWGGPATEKRIRQSLDDMAEAADCS